MKPRLWILVITLMMPTGSLLAQPGQFFRLDTHRLFYVTAGEGTPAVVIDTGVASTLDDWADMRSRLAQKTRVVSYNRAGYGESTLGPMPRGSRRIAEELKSLLQGAAIPGPYILVGHSLGGLNVQVFAHLYPELVAGLVLLDPPPLGWLLGDSFPELRTMFNEVTNQWQEIGDRGLNSDRQDEVRQAQYFLTLASEHREMFASSAGLAGNIESFGRLPLVVVAAGRSNPQFGEAAETFQKFWIEENRKLAGKSERGKFVLAGDSSHHLHVEAADLVVEEILSMLEDYGRGAKSSSPKEK